MSSVTRFAPSPNGLLHVGHALSAIIAHDTARKNGGRFLLRIEDIDLERRRPEFVTAIFEDLDWLGLTWEEPVLVQSEHFSEYLAAADRLIGVAHLVIDVDRPGGRDHTDEQGWACFILVLRAAKKS